MGPAVRQWLNIPESDYSGFENTSPTGEHVALFTDAVLESFENGSPRDDSQLVTLLEELVGMNMPLLAIKLVDAYPQLFPQDDFRAQLHLGNASMLVSDLARAEDAFIKAQSIVPAEPAPYINLTQIYCHDGLIDKARNWCLAGLDTDQDNTRLWELLAWIGQTGKSDDERDRTSVARELALIAKEKNSWAGMSLACDIQDPEDVLTKLATLERFWNEGNRSTDYLVEYTAVLGMAGQYDRIPAIIWAAEREQTNGLPWQLTLHLAQAYLGLGRDQDALDSLDKLNKVNDLPDQARGAADAIRAEVKGESLKN
jgi:tetratricopeptide (TPR) repeat protein